MSTGTKEIVIPCTDGVELAAKHWGIGNKQQIDSKERILMLHGWLDNSNSFDLLLPRLCSDEREILALDFPGHGFSGHKSPDGPPQLISDYAYYVGETLRFLNWIDGNESGGITLIGHSMGAAVSLIYAAAFPEHVSRIVLLEGAGPLARDPLDIARHIRSSVSRRLKSNQALYQLSSEEEKNQGRRKIYQNLTIAVNARKKTAELVPGQQYISTEAALSIVKRATLPIEKLPQHDSFKAGGTELSNDHIGEQVAAIYHEVQCPTCLLLADDGWPEDDWTSDAVRNKLQPQVMMHLPGSHHFHADPDTSEAVISEVLKFLAKD
ncbi:hypothetical protein CTEN210_16777 [Chaetoceros tenuissimus]|uniref:AB hydrolase-1 domain-containing protein n=1 Tax=Chaetoceros tenuissimus TaxID=426638 RepID=A0AAD3HEF0_9STRA|nr:hypothetical protein CTEN210_16777 [Chaetoceros tenuissimus]